MKAYKNSVTATKFLDWYFTNRVDVTEFARDIIEDVKNNGHYFISSEILFENCAYIPKDICEDSNGKGKYHPSEVEFIQD